MNNFTTKSLEFLCDNELSEIDFQNFIKNKILDLVLNIVIYI